MNSKLNDTVRVVTLFLMKHDGFKPTFLLLDSTIEHETDGAILQDAPRSYETFQIPTQVRHKYVHFGP